MKEIVSNCCGASLWHTESEICSQCFEHCEGEEIEETIIPRKVIEEILNKIK